MSLHAGADQASQPHSDKQQLPPDAEEAAQRWDPRKHAASLRRHLAERDTEDQEEGVRVPRVKARRKGLFDRASKKRANQCRTNSHRTKPQRGKKARHSGHLDVMQKVVGQFGKRDIVELLHVHAQSDTAPMPSESETEVSEEECSYCDTTSREVSEEEWDGE